MSISVAYLSGVDVGMYGEVLAAELEQRLQVEPGLCLIDVREPHEWQSGHIEEAQSLPLSELAERIDELERFKQDEIIFICRSGKRSGQVCEYLSTQGYQVVNVTDGMLGWNGEVTFGN